jgi:hypothetical protein
MRNRLGGLGLLAPSVAEQSSATLAGVWDRFAEAH